MTRRSIRFACALLAACAVAGAAMAQPAMTNAQVTTRSGRALAQTVQGIVAGANSVTWIGYSVPAVDGERVICCGGSGTWGNGSTISSDGANCCGACRLEPPADGTSMASRRERQTGGAPVRLEASDRLVVMLRANARAVDRIRVFSEDCQLDAGGRPVVWLQDVAPGDSIALLEAQVGAQPADMRDRVSDSAISAIALHGDAAADASLERLIAPARPESLRRKVTFWLGNARGARGLEVLRRVLREDPSDEVRRAAVFGVSQSRQPDAFAALTGLARSDASPRIRSEALFWIAQKNDPSSAGVILEALDKDAAPEVRKKAVFALGQLHDNAGVDALVRVARTHPDPAARGEAVFWLGQKAGARASAAITERIDRDPDTEVKKKAVFALSQLPASEGVPLLINVARTHTNPAVRKQAMFWLGQSKDPRAVDFFAEVLSK